MPLNHALLGELKQESTRTRKILERVPTEKLLWKPHEKSMTLARLSTHVATIPHWISRIITSEEFDFAKTPIQISNAGSNEELLNAFHETLSTNIPVLETVTDDMLSVNWTFRNGPHFAVTMPRKVALRDFAFNHLVHHRGQLSVYLRLLDIPVPGMYGPSADEI
jgi:uncharacterized damage-inducible protein DinB